METLLIKEKTLCENAGIEISQVHGPWRAPIRDSLPEERAERMEQMKRTIYAASILGCKNWVIHPLMPCGLNDDGKDTEKSTWDINLNFMQKLLTFAKEHSVIICFENMPFKSFSISKPEKILKFVKTINDSSFKICLDTGHISVFENLAVGDEVRRLGKEICALHIHDNRVSSDLHLMPYFGVIDWKDFAKSLKDIGYTGNFDLETMPPKTLPDFIFEDMSKSLFKISKMIIDNI